MRVKTALTSIALISSLAFSGVAYGATINGVDIPEDELAAVQARCDELKVADDTQSLSTTEDSDSTATDDSMTSDEPTGSSDESSAGEDAVVDNAPAVDEAANATGTIDLDTITLQACMDAGLVM